MSGMHYVTVTHQRSKLQETVGLVLMGGGEANGEGTPRVMGGWLPVRHREAVDGMWMTKRKLIPLHAIVDVEDHGPAPTAILEAFR